MSVIQRNNEEPNSVDVESKSTEPKIHESPGLPKDDPPSSGRIEIPEDDHHRIFSFRKLWAFTGPGFLMSIAYLDPGNIESDLQSGAVAQYRLIWVLLGAHVLGLIFQRMSARLSVVSGKDLGEICYIYYPKVPRILIWIMVEVAIIGSDMQEVIGTAIAFYLLSGKRIPLYGGVLITIVDTFTFLFLERFGVRKLEAFFALLISTMAVTFGYEYFVSPPNQIALLEGMFIPWCSGCNSGALLQGVGIIGAVIMPHNLYLHSSLVKSRNVDRSKKHSISEANKYYFIECTIALFCSFLINLFVMGVFGNGLFGRTNLDIREQCFANGVEDGKFFTNDTNPASVDIFHGGIFLWCAYGAAAMYIWAIGIMASGQSSTMTGTYAGQFVMEGFLQLKWAKWKRVMFTRACAIVPTILVATFLGIDNFSRMNDSLNALQALQLPFALIPVLTFTSSDVIMRDFKTGKVMGLVLPAVSLVVLGINIYSLLAYIVGMIGDVAWAYVLIAALLAVYALFVGYLITYWLLSQGFVCCAPRFWFVEKLFPMSQSLNSALESPWLIEEDDTGGIIGESRYSD